MLTVKDFIVALQQNAWGRFGYKIIFKKTIDLELNLTVMLYLGINAEMKEEEKLCSVLSNMSFMWFLSARV